MDMKNSRTSQSLRWAAYKFALLFATLCLTACGTIMTRPYAPISEPPEAVSEPAFRESFSRCVKQVTGIDGVYYDGRATKSGVGATTALGTASAVSGVALATAGSTYASVAGALGTVIVVLPAAGAYGIYRGVKVSERDKVEQEILEGVSECMATQHYVIKAWVRIEKGKIAVMATPVGKPETVRPHRLNLKSVP